MVGQCHRFKEFVLPSFASKNIVLTVVDKRGSADRRLGGKQGIYRAVLLLMCLSASHYSDWCKYKNITVDQAQTQL